MGAVFVLALSFPVLGQTQGFSGYVETKGSGYFERTTSQDPWSLGWGTLFAKYEEKMGAAQLTASVRGETITSADQGARLFDPADRELHRAPLSLPELWLRLPLAPHHDLQVGHFQLGWGKTDGYSPADAFLPRDLTDPFADEKLPLWALRLSGEEKGIRYETVVVPVTTPWRLPVLGSRNAPLAGSGAAGLVFAEQDSSPPGEGFAAMRLLATVGAWDLGGWGRFGVRPAPLLDFRFPDALVTPAGPTVPVARRYAREEGLGLELSRVVGPWVLRGEAAALFAADPELGNALIGALSGERGFGDSTLLVTLAGNALTPPVAAPLLFDRALLPAAIVAWNRSEEWGGWKVVWSAGLRRGDGLLKSEVGYNLTDLWKISLGGELPYGSEQGPLGALQAARQLHLALRRSW